MTPTHYPRKVATIPSRVRRASTCNRLGLPISTPWWIGNWLPGASGWSDNSKQARGVLALPVAGSSQVPESWRKHPRAERTSLFGIDVDGKADRRTADGHQELRGTQLDWDRNTAPRLRFPQRQRRCRLRLIRARVRCHHVSQRQLQRTSDELRCNRFSDSQRLGSIDSGADRAPSGQLRSIRTRTIRSN